LYTGEWGLTEILLPVILVRTKWYQGVKVKGNAVT
jgi:hypothetical protein